VIVTVAVGIGATTAIFTVASQVLLQPLRIPSAERVVVLESTNPRQGTAFSAAEGVFTDWRTRWRSFEVMAGCWPTTMILSGVGQPHDVFVNEATAGFFQIAGLLPHQGSLFSSSAELPGMSTSHFLMRASGGVSLAAARASSGSRSN